jgi:exopolysaccharide biosynthesis polyprenyl glycosylphosphotransferase
MKTLLSKTRDNVRRNIRDFFFNTSLCDQTSDLYLEEYFQNLLCLERKRTERSRKPFLLTLLNIEKVLQGNERNMKVNEISQVLFTTTRETDIKGWFKYDAVIGIISTEINGTDKQVIKQKILDNLNAFMEREKVDKIHITCYFFPEQRGNGEHAFVEEFYPDLIKKKKAKKISSGIKRALDITGSIAALIIFSPVFLIIPLLVKFSSKGPVLFRQARVGRYGENFTFLKFRTMYVNNDVSIHQEYVKKFICEQKSYADEKANGDKTCTYKIKDDPRITLVGRFLRKTSLDEFPQFINVFKGEMSLVGPRPPIPYELENYDIWHRRRVLETKPGITGLWQVKGRSRTTFDEMVRLDLRYIREWSLWLDIKILLQTPLAVLNGKGAY